MRMIENSAARKWPSSKDTAAFPSPLDNMAAGELELLLKGYRFDGEQRNMVPNRSGSAPPNMEGSFAAFGNLVAQLGLATFTSSIANCEIEEQLRADPAYLVYYSSNINLNPRLPPPIISEENRRLVNHIGVFHNQWRFGSSDDGINRSLHLARGSLSTHNEEHEDDISPRLGSPGYSEKANMFMSGVSAASLSARHKSLVDLIQEDFPRTPSPMYNQSRSLNNATTEEPVDHDIAAISLDNLSLNASKVMELEMGSDNLCFDTNHKEINANGPTSSGSPSVMSFAKSSCPDKTKSLHLHPNIELVNKDADFGDNVCATDSTSSGAFTQGQSYEKNVQRQQNSLSQEATGYQLHEAHAQGISFEANRLQRGMLKNFHSLNTLSGETQPVMQHPGLTPPLYATAAYITSESPFYPSLYPWSLYSPQYSIAGYALGSTLLSPFTGGYPSHTGIPVHYDAISGQSLNRQTTLSASAGESVSNTNINKFYEHHGLLRPSFMDPMQYYQQFFGDPYGASGHYAWLASMGAVGNQANSYHLQKEVTLAAYRADQEFHPPLNRSLTASPRKGGTSSITFYGSHPNAGIVSQIPASTLGCPLLPVSPVAGANHSGRTNEVILSQSYSRNMGPWSGGQGHRGIDTFTDSKKHSFLEELRSSNAHKIDLSDIAGRIVEFSVDQHGSRFIQQKLETCGVEEKAAVFKEVILDASKLMTDVFGNYVIQKFFQHGSHEQRRKLADQLSGRMLHLSMQMYGCRVIQKALEVIELDQKTELALELDGHVMRCVRDQNGNHVIQKCIECIPTEKIGFIISAFQGQVASHSTHPYGCRVIQRILEHCSDDLLSQGMVDEILQSVYDLTEDQYGNYVIQHVLERGKPHERRQIISKLTGKIVQMSQHKYASNVVEKCLEYGDTAEWEALIGEILGQPDESDNLLAMMKDQFANYVVQKILETSNDEQRKILLNRIRVHLHSLKKYTYGKHIVARFGQLSSEEDDALQL